MATGNLTPTDQHLEDYLGTLQVKPKTKAMGQSTLRQMAARFPMLQDVDRLAVRKWVTELLTGHKAATVQRMMSDCRSYWRLLAEDVNTVPEDSAPFDRLRLKVEYDNYVPWMPEEAVALHRRATGDGDQELADLVMLAMYTGARRGELVALRPEGIKDDSFRIRDAKTKAGVRTVPVRSALRETMARLIDGAAGNRHGGLFHSSGNKLGERFTAMKQAMGYGSREHAFHGLRGTVITALEHAGVVEGIVQDIVGHSRSTLTGSTYSDKSPMKQVREALARRAALL